MEWIRLLTLIGYTIALGICLGVAIIVGRWVCGWVCGLIIAAVLCVGAMIVSALVDDNGRTRRRSV